MSLRGFKQAGHFPTLLSAFLYFDVSFMVWVILGPLGPFIGDAYHLTATQKGLLTAIPLLGGSFFRPILGWSTERFGGRKTGLFGLALSLIPLLIGWQFAHSFSAFLGMGLLLGVAGASFAAALPLASGWYPPEHQGLAMGIAGAGNSGTLLATLFAPRLARAFGWRNVFAMAAVPVIAGLDSILPPCQGCSGFTSRQKMERLRRRPACRRHRLVLLPVLPDVRWLQRSGQLSCPSSFTINTT